MPTDLTQQLYRHYISINRQCRNTSTATREDIWLMTDKTQNHTQLQCTSGTGTRRRTDEYLLEIIRNAVAYLI